MSVVTGWPGSPQPLGTGDEVFVRHAGPAGSDAGPDGEPGAEPVAFVHGLGGSSTNWTALMRELRATPGRRPLDQWALDLPGFGESAPSGRHTVPAYVADVIAWLETFDRPVHLVGNSMGGLVSVFVAAARPDLVATLALLSPAMPQYRVPSGALMNGLLAVPRVGERLLSAGAALSPEVQDARLAAMMFGDPTAVDPDEFAFAAEQRSRWAGLQHADAVLLSALRSIVRIYLRGSGGPAWAAARRVLCPTMVMLSGRDLVVGSWAAGRWRRTKPRARIVQLPSSGHVAMMEHPHEVADLVRTFLAETSTGRTARRGMPPGVAPLPKESESGETRDHAKHAPT